MRAFCYYTFNIIKKVMTMFFQLYNDGAEWGTATTEQQAQAIVDSYDGDHEVWYERVDEEEE